LFPATSLKDLSSVEEPANAIEKLDSTSAKISTNESTFFISNIPPLELFFEGVLLFYCEQITFPF